MVAVIITGLLFALVVCMHISNSRKNDRDINADIVERMIKADDERTRRYPTLFDPSTIETLK